MRPAVNLRLMVSVASATWDCPHCGAVLVRKLAWVRVTGPHINCPRCFQTSYVDLAKLGLGNMKGGHNDRGQETH